MIGRSTRTVFAVLALCGAVAAVPQTAPPPSGHWVGAIEAGQKLAVEVDIAREGEGWRATISIPAQGTKGVPLVDVSVKNPAVSFAIKGAPGDPRFAGQVSPDGKTLTGTFSQGGGSVPMSLEWKGEAQFEKAVKNAAISKAVVGTWEGPLEARGTTLLLRLILANGPEGATGTMVSVSQGGVEMPASAIVEKGTHLTVTIAMISAAFDGEVKDDAISGTWTQGPATFPLVFKRKP